MADRTVRKRDVPVGPNPQTAWPSRSGTGGRKLLPLALVDALAAAALQERHHRAGQTGEEHEQEELLLAALLLFVLPHPSLLPSWPWMDLNHRPHPYQGCPLTP